MRLINKAVRSAVFVLFLVANPAYLVACAGSEDGASNDPFTYGESDMIALMDALNSTESWLFDGYEMELSVSQSGADAVSLNTQERGATTFVRSAHACETRSFVKSAAACISMSELPVDGTMRLFERLENGERSPIDELEVSGVIRVMSLNLTHAELDLSFENGSSFLFWDEQLGDEFVLQQFNASNLGDQEVTIAYSSDH